MSLNIWVSSSAHLDWFNSDNPQTVYQVNSSFYPSSSKSCLAGVKAECIPLCGCGVADESVIPYGKKTHFIDNTDQY